MNQEVMKEWINKVWRKRKNSFFNRNSLLIIDSAPAHKTDDIKKEIKLYSDLAVIPGGMTKVLQPLDISVNRSFKNKDRNLWRNWMVNGYKEFTKSGKMKKASYGEVCQWISIAWNDVTIDCIKDGFKASKINYYNVDETFNFHPVSDNQTELDIPLELQNILDVFDNFSDESFDGF